MKPIVLCILDGWGHREATEHNAMAAAKTPHWDRLTAQYPMSLLGTSGADVGLPDGQMGNSEVGHMAIGSGRIVMQELPRIDGAIADGSLAKNSVLTSMIANLKKSGKACHLMGLCSDGGVHAHIHHIISLAKIIANENVKVNIHAFLDGRDTPPSSAPAFVKELEALVAAEKNVKIATVSGRYYAMDRDKRWDRVQKAYDVLAHAKGDKVASASDAVKQSYANEKTDEFVLPVVVDGYAGMQDGDAVLMANFRADRARQLLTALLDDKFDGFARGKKIQFSAAVGMVEYSDKLSPLMTTLFTSEPLTNLLAEVLAARGINQLRVAETEKYAHVTFFFNGGKETPVKGEDRSLVPSPKVATYDLQPEMSSAEVTDKVVEGIESGNYGLIVVNYANTDMVGHTGDLKAAALAVEAVDRALGRISAAIEKKNGIMLVTADHGNAEEMHDHENESPHTQHTLNPVPFLGVGLEKGKVSLKNGRLSDIAPTILTLMELPIPKEMTGKSLVA